MTDREPLCSADDHFSDSPTHHLTAQRVAILHPGWQMDVWTAGDPQLEALVASGALAGILYFGVPELIPTAAATTGIPVAHFSPPDMSPSAELHIAGQPHDLFDLSLRSHLAHGRTRIGVLDPDTLASGHFTDPAPSANRPGSNLSIR